MSGLSEKVAAEHALNPHDGGCSCGEWSYGAWTLKWEIDIDGHRRHVADVTERAVREQIAWQLEARVTRNIGGHPYSDVARTYQHAARIAREGTTP